MTDADLTAILEQIREQREWTALFRLVKALEAVLELAAGSQVMAADWGRCTHACERGPCDCGGGLPLAWDLDPAKVREAIARALAAVTPPARSPGNAEKPPP